MGQQQYGWRVANHSGHQQGCGAVGQLLQSRDKSVIGRLFRRQASSQINNVQLHILSGIVRKIRMCNDGLDNSLRENTTCSLQYVRRSGITDSQSARRSSCVSVWHGAPWKEEEPWISGKNCGHVEATSIKSVRNETNIVCGRATSLCFFQGVLLDRMNVGEGKPLVDLLGG